MPQTAKSNKWFVRVDGNKEFLEQKLKELKGAIDTEKILGLYHLGEKSDNPHCHFVITTSTEIQQQSFNIRVKKLFAIEKKSQFSVKVWNGEDGACSYMFHECNEVILINKGYSDDDISKFRELNSKVQEVIAINKQRGGRVVDKLLERYGDDTPSRREILNDMLEMVRDGEMYEPGDYQLMKYVEEVYLKTTGKVDFEEYVEERYRKLFLR